MRILINRTDAIGDTILTMPMIYQIKQKFPDAEIDFLVAPISYDLFKGLDHIVQAHVFPKKSGRFQQLSFLHKLFRQRSYNYYFHVGGSHLPSFVAFLHRVSFRGGLKTKWPSFLWLNQGERQRRSLVEMHESEYNLSLLEKMGIPFHFKDLENINLRFNFSASEIEDAWNNLQAKINQEQKRNNAELIFVHPGMTGHTLNWPSRNYARFISRMERRHPGRFLFVVSHTPSDARFLVAIQEELSKKKNEDMANAVLFFDGSEQGLRNYMALLNRAKLFIGPSTGTLHIANVVGVKSIGVFSPIKVQSSFRWAPFYEKNKYTELVIPDVVCGEQFKCAEHACPYFECMAKIEVDWVVDKAEELLAR